MRVHNLVFIDLETTGLDPERHEIIEIGGIIARQAPRAGQGPAVEKIEEFVWKVKPEHLATADPESLQINGYNEADWLFAIDLKQAMTVLAEKTVGAILVAQNITFEWSFLEQAFKKTGVANRMHYHKLDLIPMTYAKLYDDPTMEKFSLRAMCERFGVVNEKAHNALTDIRATFEVYKKLVDA